MPAPDQLLGDLLDQVSDGVCFVDRDLRVTFWNASAERISGFSAARIVGERCRDHLMHVSEQGVRLCDGACPVRLLLEDGKPREVRVFLRHAQGHRVPVRVRVVPVQNASGATTGAAQVFSEGTITSEIRRQLEELRQLALVDPETGVGNRRWYDITLRTRVDENRRYGWQFGLVLAEIDNFREAADRLGPEVSAALLGMVARTLTHALRSTDVVVRWAGERFAVVLANADVVSLRPVAERLRLLVGESALPPGDLRVTVSIGATLARSGESPDTFAARANAFLHRARAAGGNRVIADGDPDTGVPI